MAIIRQQNWLGQQRVDVAHLRAIESAVCADFDLLAGRIVAGKQAIVVSGFGLNNLGVTHVSQLKLKVANSVILHFYASESGSIFAVPSDRPDEGLTSTNPRVMGQFAALQTNFVGIDLVRVADDTTVDLTMFLDATSLIETPKEVPLARTLDYRIVVSTIDFSTTPGICPIARVSTDANNNITEIQDARNLMFRLGAGGTAPNRTYSYPWPDGRREFASTSDDVFTGGDKSIGSLKAWCNAVMTRIWENSGGEYWYSPTSERNVRMVHAGDPFLSTGEFFEWDGTNLHWQGLRVIFDNSTGYFNEVENQTTDQVGLTDLATGECIYVDLDRTRNRSTGHQLKAKRGVLKTLGTGVPPGSRLVLVWRHGAQVFTRDQGYSVNSSFHLATTAAAGTVLLSAQDPGTGSAVRVATVTANTGRQAMAGGVSRGQGEFVGGAGDVVIGGGVLDRNIVIGTTFGDRNIRISGPNHFATSGVATLDIQNTGSTGTRADWLNDRVARFAAYGDGGGMETAFIVESLGAVGWRNAPLLPASPVPTELDPIRSKMFFQVNGLASPATRDQFCVMWFDGSVTVLAQGPAY